MNQKKFSQYAPWIAASLTALYFGICMLPPSDRTDDFNYRDFGRLPVIDGGRYKPMDTVARMNLMVITHRQALYDPATKTTYPATKWMLDALTTPLPNDEVLNRLFANGAEEQRAWRDKIFRIESDQVLTLLGLKMREGLRYSFLEVAANSKELFAEALRIGGDEEQGIKGVDPKKWTLRDAKLMELFGHFNLFMKMSGHSRLLVIPNPDGSDEWKHFRGYLQEVMVQGDQIGDGVDSLTFRTYAQLLMLYDQKKPKEFNKAIASHLAELGKTSPALVGKIDTEVFFNEFAPFYHCLIMYVLIALLGALSWMTTTYSEPLRKAAYAAMAVSFVVHLTGLILRMYLQDRLFVFVTNLYSSAVFIGLGCVFVCLIAEWFYRNGIAIVVGSKTGFCTLIIAHMLSLDGDTMIMMQAVLDTNFWLATHVTCVTLGYTMAFVAGFMGFAYIVLGIFTHKLRADGSANLTRMTYGVLCAGMFLSFVGTVLGGLWADYSWGRFWGWDPKENGALLIVIWIALILHARWGGMVKHRGIAVLSVLGIIITSWSWFGTNFLGVGLHAYGGAKGGAMMALIMIDLSFLAIASLGLLPLHMWKSFQPPVPTPPPAQATMTPHPKMA